MDPHEPATGGWHQTVRRIFFYGLFMDPELLRVQGLHPALAGPAELPGFRIHIGDRASLIPSAGATSYGMLIDLGDDEAAALYSAPDVSDYVPERVDAILLEDRGVHPAWCYNLPADALGAGANPEYAERLSALVVELGFPAAYASEITRFGGG